MNQVVQSTLRIVQRSRTRSLDGVTNRHDAGPRRRRVTRRPGAIAALALVVAALGVTVAPGAVLAEDPPATDPPTTTTPPTTAPPTTSPPPTTEPPTTLPPDPDPTVPPTVTTAPPVTSGGGGVPRAVTSTTVDPLDAGEPRSTVVAPTGDANLPETGVLPDPTTTGPEQGWLTPERQVRVAVGGLLTLAAVMAVLGFAYWRHTRPGVSGGGEGAGEAESGKSLRFARRRDPEVDAPLAGERPELFDDAAFDDPGLSGAPALARLAAPGGASSPAAPRRSAGDPVSAAPAPSVPPPRVELRLRPDRPLRPAPPEN